MKIFRSIRWRIQMWQSLLLALIVVVLGFLFHMHLKQSFIASLDHKLLAGLTHLYPTFRNGGQLVPSPERSGSERPLPQSAPSVSPPPGAPSRRNRELINRRRRMVEGRLFGKNPTGSSPGGNAYFVVWFANGDPRVSSENAPDDVPFIPNIEPLSQAKLHTRGNFREAYGSTPELSCVITGMDLRHVRGTFLGYAWGIGVSCSGVILFGILVGWKLTGIAVRPFDRIREVTERIASGSLDARIPADGYIGEIKELSFTLNHTFERLEHAFDQQRRFTADASHELRTPLASAILETQIALRKERSAEEYRRRLANSLKNLTQLRTLSDALLNLTRLDMVSMTLMRGPCDLAELVHNSLPALNLLMEDSGKHLTTDLKPASFSGDPIGIQQIINNLISNAIHYSPEKVDIHVQTGIQGAYAMLVVSNQGPPIPPADLRNLFERFYRSAEARKKNPSGSGLGLPISQSIVQQHGGLIEASSNEQEGTRFIVLLPSAPPRT